MTLDSAPVLIHGNDVGVRENRLRLSAHCAHVVAGDERRIQNRP